MTTLPICLWLSSSARRRSTFFPVRSVAESYTSVTRPCWTLAARRTATVETPYGEVSCKISAHKGHIVSVSAEYEDCRRLAKEKNVPIKKVRADAIAELRRRLGE